MPRRPFDFENYTEVNEMPFNIVLDFIYKDGGNYQMTVRVPEAVATQISRFNLVATRVYCEPVYGAADNIPRLEDFIKKADITGMNITNGGKQNG